VNEEELSFLYPIAFSAKKFSVNKRADRTFEIEPMPLGQSILFSIYHITANRAGHNVICFSPHQNTQQYSKKEQVYVYRGNLLILSVRRTHQAKKEIKKGQEKEKK
jgi:hypothetical protein